MKSLLVLMPFFVLVFSCSKSNTVIDSEGNVTDTIPVSYDNSDIKIFENLRFSAVRITDENSYFSTFDTTFSAPTSKYHLSAQQLKNVDLLYIHDYNVWRPGFMDPVTASQTWYWNEDIYYHPELDSSIKTIFYLTDLSQQQFDSTKLDKRFFDRYFTDSHINIAMHNVFPEGSCIGGNYSGGNYSPFSKGEVLAFKNVLTDKRGFIFLRYDQESGWPTVPITSFSTKVDITKEK